MRSNTMIPLEIQKLLQSRYNIVGNISFQEFDHDWQHLERFFQTTRPEIFGPDDRYVIEHQDTDIYIEEMLVGINLRNFFQIVHKLDIPQYTIVIWTNHFGLQSELDLLCHGQDPNDRPGLIETFCNIWHVADRYDNFDLDANAIQLHALTMMGANRSHRFALYNAIKDLAPDRVAISIKGTKS